MVPVTVPLASLKYSNNQQFITPELGKLELLSIISLPSTCSETTKSRTSLSAPVHQSNRIPPGYVFIELPRYCSIPTTIDATNVPWETITSPSQVPVAFSKSNRDSFSSNKAPLLDTIWEEPLSPSTQDPIWVFNPFASSFRCFGRLNPHLNPAWKGPSWASIVSKRPGASTKFWIIRPRRKCTNKNLKIFASTKDSPFSEAPACKILNQIATTVLNSAADNVADAVTEVAAPPPISVSAAPFPSVSANSNLATYTKVHATATDATVAAPAHDPWILVSSKRNNNHAPRNNNQGLVAVAAPKLAKTLADGNPVATHRFPDHVLVAAKNSL